MTRATREELTRWASECLRKVGVPEAQATLVATSLV